MNGIQKIELLEEIGSELQQRMTFSDIDNYFRGHGVPTVENYPTNSKRAYAKDMLADVEEKLLFKIADELDLTHPATEIANVKEVTFWKSGHFKLFLSHLASFKVQTSHLQTALKKYAISSFVAHEDIEPTKEWQLEIEAGLKTMDALAAILMPGFKESNWCDQEVGVAVGRDVLIIPIRRDLDPYGFIGKYQGIQSKDKSIGEVAEAIFQTLVKSPKTSNKILLSFSGSIASETTPEAAIEKISLLKSLDSIPEDILENLKSQVSENNLLTDSTEFINQFNSMLTKFNVSKLTFGIENIEKQYDDVPF